MAAGDHTPRCRGVTRANPIAALEAANLTPQIAPLCALVNDVESWVPSRTTIRPSPYGGERSQEMRLAATVYQRRLKIPEVLDFIARDNPSLGQHFGCSKSTLLNLIAGLIRPTMRASSTTAPRCWSSSTERSSRRPRDRALG